MSPSELSSILSRLSLSQTEAAQLLGIAPRTIRRWLDGEEVPGPAEHALQAWVKLESRRLAWRPDSVSIVDDDQNQIGLYRAKSIELEQVITKVEKRGGPRITWSVDKERCLATFGPMEISYYLLHNGGFSPSYYTHREKNPDRVAEWEFIEDAFYCIAMALRPGKEPLKNDAYLVKRPEADYKVTGTCLAKFEKLDMYERRDALEKARRLSGKNAMIDSQCL